MIDDRARFNMVLGLARTSEDSAEREQMMNEEGQMVAAQRCQIKPGCYAHPTVVFLRFLLYVSVG